MKFVLTIDTDVVPTCGALSKTLVRLAKRFDKEDEDALIVDCCHFTESDLVRSGELFTTNGETDLLYGHWTLVEES